MTIISPRVKKWVIPAGGAAVLGVLATLLLTTHAADVARHVTDITSIDQLKEAFNRDAGTPRLVVIVSPT